jgi:hypothetical protein
MIRPEDAALHSKIMELLDGLEIRNAMPVLYRKLKKVKSPFL